MWIPLMMELEYGETILSIFIYVIGIWKAPYVRIHVWNQISKLLTLGLEGWASNKHHRSTSDLIALSVKLDNCATMPLIFLWFCILVQMFSFPRSWFVLVIWFYVFYHIHAKSVSKRWVFAFHKWNCNRVTISIAALSRSPFCNCHKIRW